MNKTCFKKKEILQSTPSASSSCCHSKDLILGVLHCRPGHSAARGQGLMLYPAGRCLYRSVEVT